MSKTALVTGAAGLVGSEAVQLCFEKGFDTVIGIDSNARKEFFGSEGSTLETGYRLAEEYYGFELHQVDINNISVVKSLMMKYNPELIIHAAAQPSHDWAAKDPFRDFEVNALGTLSMLEATRDCAPDGATFAHISTSKVYGDTPNRLPLVEERDRYSVVRGHPYFNGVDTSMSIDQSLHSLFGVSKASGDLLVQEYGKYFGMPTVCFRPGCVTGSAHAGVELHGFLNYLIKCAVIGRTYTVYGYKGKQVRCNISGRDLANACLVFHNSPQSGTVYNIGGGIANSISILEAASLCNYNFGHELQTELVETPRRGDHQWWVSNNKPFELDYPDWKLQDPLLPLMREIYENNVEGWLHESKSANNNV